MLFIILALIKLCEILMQYIEILVDTFKGKIKIKSLMIIKHM
jgi:hypothetical protein